MRTDPDWPAIDRLQKEWRPDGLIVGDPMTLDGGDQPIRTFAHAFAAQLQARYALPVVLVDERASSIEAAQRFAADRAEGRRKRRDAAALDAVAAAVIVERWLAAPQDGIASGPGNASDMSADRSTTRAACATC